MMTGSENRRNCEKHVSVSFRSPRIYANTTTICKHFDVSGDCMKKFDNRNFNAGNSDLK
jgi:hypothetical protein